MLSGNVPLRFANSIMELRSFLRLLSNHLMNDDEEMGHYDHTILMSCSPINFIGMIY